MTDKNIILFPEPDDSLKQQAHAWVVRLNSGEVTKGDRIAFMRWIEQGRSHRDAFFEARRLWRQLGHLDMDEETIRSFDDSKSISKVRKPRIGTFRWAMAFAVLFTGVGLVHPFYTRHVVADFFTEVGEIKTLQLDDGSKVHMNTDSMIAVHFSSSERNIELLSGEAEFDVAHDNKRPFIVSAGSGQTCALGTRFVVNYRADKVRVSVLENRVEISSENHAPVILDSGYRLIYGNKSLLDIPKRFDASDAMAWREGKVEFNAQSLQEVIAEIDRYLPGKILLLNEKLADHEVSGVFQISHLDQAVNIIAQSLRLHTTQVGSWLYVIY